jgi:hypothetical protein
MKSFIIFCLTLVLTSCGITTSFELINLKEKTLIDFPEKGITVTASLGDRLVAKGYKEDGPAYDLNEGLIVQNVILNCSFTNASRQSYFVNKVNSNGDECAGPFVLSTSLESGGTNLNCPGKTFAKDICYNKSKDIFYVNFPNQYKPIDSNLIQKTRKMTMAQANYVQELIYNGRVDNNLRFIYREFSGDMIRPAFNQTVQYDFNDSKLISFKGLTLEIIEANNQLIRYKLISNF